MDYIYYVILIKSLSDRGSNWLRKVIMIIIESNDLACLMWFHILRDF